MTASVGVVWPALRGITPAALLLAALSALLVALAVWRWPGRPDWESSLRHREDRRRVPRRRRRPGTPPWAGAQPLLEEVGGRLLPAPLRSALAEQLLRAGVSTTPERVLGEQLLAVLAAAAVVAVLWGMGLIPIVAAPLLLLALPTLALLRLLRTADTRRRTALAQLPILVDLMSLEQTGGGVGARRAMEMVVARVRGEAAAVLRQCLTRSAAPGTPPLDSQLESAAARLRLPPLAALAVVVRMQREEGISTSTPLGQLAHSLRDRQRDELTARGRRALVSMLLPVALCILLPFLLIILYPALERLAGALG